MFQKGKDQAFRYIATLELLGTLLGMQAFVWDSGDADSFVEVSATALTDNLGNKYALQKFLTPMCCVLMELASRSLSHGGELDRTR